MVTQEQSPQQSPQQPQYRITFDNPAFIADLICDHFIPKDAKNITKNFCEFIASNDKYAPQYYYLLLYVSCLELATAPHECLIHPINLANELHDLIITCPYRTPSISKYNFTKLFNENPYNSQLNFEECFRARIHGAYIRQQISENLPSLNMEVYEPLTNYLKNPNNLHNRRGICVYQTFFLLFQTGLPHHTLQLIELCFLQRLRNIQETQ